jgi:hypothetical protein
MSKKSNEERAIQKKVYVSEDTLAELFSYKYANKHKNMDETIQDLLQRVKENSSK